MIEDKFHTGVLEIFAQPVDELLHAVRRRNRATKLWTHRASSFQMPGQSCLSKDQAGTQTFRIAGIDSAQRRSEEEIRRSFANHAPAPVDDGFKRPGAQTAGAGGKSETQLQDFGAAERES